MSTENKTPQILHPHQEGNLGILLELLKKLILHPQVFFSGLDQYKQGLGFIFAFGLICHWIGSVFEHLWNSLLTISIERRLQNWGQLLRQLGGDSESINSWSSLLQETSKADTVKSWFQSVSSVILDPFTTSLYILFSAVLIFIAARILVPSEQFTISDPRRRVTFDSALRIVCVSLAGALFNFLPYIGQLVAGLISMLITYFGIKETYQIGWIRTSFIMFLPGLLFLSIFFAVIFGVFLMIAGIAITSFF